MTKPYKGIVLAGGTGTRLHPITLGTSKQLLPVYDKPMIYYPLSVLMLSGINEILIISTPYDIERYKSLLGDGSTFGIEIDYAIQSRPGGIAESFIIGEDFIDDKNIALILGDNIFYGHNFDKNLKLASSRNIGATIFGHYVRNPQEFGVVEFDKSRKVISIEEKPEIPKSNYAVTGLYFYDNDVVKIAKSIKPSKRGELEITDINNIYKDKNILNIEILGRGFAWLDTGTHEALIEASNFIQTIEKRQGLKVACLEEIAFVNNWIDESMLKKQAQKFKKTGYGKYLQNLINTYQ